MQKNTPMTIVLYGENDEEKARFTRSFVPWKMLKKAIKINKDLNPDEMTEADINAVASLVVEVFGDQFTIEDLDNGADISNMLAVLQEIIARASGTSLNPTPPVS